MADVATMNAAERLRAFEDAALGPDVLRLQGRIEDGPGSRFSRLSESDQAHHRALCSLCVVEHLRDMAAAEHARLDGVYKAALEKVRSTARTVTQTTVTKKELA